MSRRYRNSAGRMFPGPGTFATKGDAQRWLATAEADQLRGTFVDQRGLRLTFDEWAEEWLAAKPGQRAATLARDHAAIRTHFSPAIGQLGLPAVTPGHIRSIVVAMQAAGLSPKSVRTYVGMLQAIFGAAVDSDLLARSPVRPRTLGLAPVRRPERPTLTAEQLVRLVDAMPPRYRVLVLLAGTVGLRWGEAIGLRVADVEFLRRTLSVGQTVKEVSGHVRVVAATKSEAGKRTFALPAFLVDELAAHIAAHRPGAGPDDHVFLGPKGGILRRSFEARVFKPSVDAAGLSEILTFHGLRHVATTLMIANNEHPKVIQHRLGHADPAMSLGVYGHVPDDLDQAASVRLDDLFRPKPTNEGSGGQIQVEADQIDRAVRSLQAEDDEPAHEPPHGDQHASGGDALDDLGESVEPGGEAVHDRRQVDDEKVGRGRFAVGSPVSGSSSSSCSKNDSVTRTRRRGCVTNRRW